MEVGEMEMFGFGHLAPGPARFCLLASEQPRVLVGVSPVHDDEIEVVPFPDVDGLEGDRSTRDEFRGELHNLGLPRDGEVWDVFPVTIPTRFRALPAQLA